jgi:hypothetical protein
MSEERDRKKEDVPPAGPHAVPKLSDEDKTPGSGMLPPVNKEQGPNEAPSG